MRKKYTNIPTEYYVYSTFLSLCLQENLSEDMKKNAVYSMPSFLEVSGAVHSCSLHQVTVCVYTYISR